MFDTQAWIKALSGLRVDLAMIAPGKFCVWSGMDEVEPGVLEMPYPTYHEYADEIWPLLNEGGIAVTGVDWVAWSNTDPPPPVMLNAEAFHSASLEEVAMYLAALRRAEHFSDGALGAAYDEGRLLAAFDRLIELAPASPYDGGTSPWAERG